MEPDSLTVQTTQTIDALPRPVRLLQHEYGMLVVTLYLEGVKSPAKLRYMAEGIRRARQDARLTS